MANSRFAFFGTPRLSTIVLDELKTAQLLPTLIVTVPDKPAGRGLTLTPSPVKTWAGAHSIEVLTPTKVRDTAFLNELRARGPWDFFVVAAYGKILPKELLDIPRKGVLNVHPSLLPRLRGASPIQSAIITDEKHTGVTIMLIDEEMDHGPILAQEPVEVEPWPPRAGELEERLARAGGSLLAKTIPAWLAGSVTPKEQDHRTATFCKKIEKEDGFLDFSADPYQNFLKIRAFSEWPGTYFYARRGGKDVRVKIADATYANGALTITRVIPEGKREMSYDDFLRSA